MIFTVGHSTRTLEEFLDLLRAHGIELLVDVRRYPASRRHPHFNREALAGALAGAGIDYRWMPELGGRRSRRKDSPHTAWKVAAFAGYADHMDTAEFLDAATALRQVAETRRTAVMCAEALPHQCHRRLLADWLTVQGVPVEHLMTEKRKEAHELTDFARVEGKRLLYDRGQRTLL